MAIPLRRVSIDVHDIVGTVMPNVLVRMTLMRADVYDDGTPDGTVVPVGSTQVRTDANGRGYLDVFPNALGTQGTAYGVDMYDENGVQVFPGQQVRMAGAVVPDTDCYLHAILFTAPPISRADAEHFAALAMQYMDAAASSASAAQEAAGLLGSGVATQQWQPPWTDSKPGPWVIIWQSKPSMKYFRDGWSTAGDCTDAINKAFAATNAGEFKGLGFPHGNPVISAPLTPLVGTEFAIYPEEGPRTTTLIMDVGAGTPGQVFQLGTDTQTAARFVIEGFRLRFDNVPDQQQHAIWAVNAADYIVNAFTFNNAAGVVRNGSPTAPGGRRATYRDLKGDFNKGGNTRGNFLLQRGANICYDGIVMSCAAVCTQGAIFDTTLGSMFLIAPQGDDLCDTIELNGVRLQSAIPAVVPTDATGKPYGLLADDTGGNITNMILYGLCVFDHTTNVALWWRGGGRASRCIHWTDVRSASDNGRVLYVENVADANGELVRDMNFRSLHLKGAGAYTLAEITGNGFNACQFKDSTILDTNASIQKPWGLKVNADGWDTGGHTIGSTTGYGAGKVGIQRGYGTDNAALTHGRFARNMVDPGIPVKRSFPRFTTRSAELVIGSGESPYIWQTQDLLDAFGTAAKSSTATAVDDVMRGLVDADLFSYIDILYLFGLHAQDAALLNVKAPGSWKLAILGSPVFTANQGFRGNGVDGMLNMGKTLAQLDADASLMYARDDASFGVYVRAGGTANSQVAVSSATPMLRITPTTGVNLQARLNNAASILLGANVDRFGHFTICRNGAKVEGYKNGALNGTANVPSDDPSLDSAGTIRFFPGGLQDMQLKAAYFGRYLPVDKVAALHAILAPFAP